MKRILTTCFVVSLLLSAHLSSAQTGIHVSFLHYEALTPRGTVNFVFGVDKDISPKSGFAIDLNAGYGGSNVFRSLNIYSYDYGDNGFERTNYFVGGLYLPLQYKSTVSTFGLTYRSYFFVSGQKNAGFYVGPFIGFRYVHQKLITEVLDYYNVNYTTFPPYSSTTWNKVQVPLGLRFGLRTGLPGFLGNLFFGVGYQAGNKEPEVKYLIKKDQLSPLFMQFGFSMGGGWGGKK